MEQELMGHEGSQSSTVPPSIPGTEPSSLSPSCSQDQQVSHKSPARWSRRLGTATGKHPGDALRLSVSTAWQVKCGENVFRLCWFQTLWLQTCRTFTIRICRDLALQSSDSNGLKWSCFGRFPTTGHLSRGTILQTLKLFLQPNYPDATTYTVPAPTCFFG